MLMALLPVIWALHLPARGQVVVLMARLATSAQRQAGAFRLLAAWNRLGLVARDREAVVWAWTAARALGVLRWGVRAEAVPARHERADSA
ncbi:hypothetical protein AWC06_16270 [Mycobacterium fragae]|uniref:Uncharacterized protein n=1 Tax=Mycobacterium fragae TaxID=1260918 RepID=A0A1X1US29_9MYCO|nr:hypothetical protein AWC06_16270 [Mycobacterium fragae]